MSRNPTRTRRLVASVSLAAVVHCAGAASHTASASAPPTVPDDTGGTGSTPVERAPVETRAGRTPATSLPDGSVRLVDDTGFISVVVPGTWTDVATAPTAAPGESDLRPFIAAATDIDEFQGTFDVAGALYVAFAFTPDPATVIDRSGLIEGCATIEVEPYDDGTLVGVVQDGDNCGADAGVWNMIVASPADESFTAVVQVQTASPDDQDAFDLVLESFTFAGDPAAPDGLLTGSAVPVDRIPADSTPGETTTAADRSERAASGRQGRPS